MKLRILIATLFLGLSALPALAGATAPASGGASQALQAVLQLQGFSKSTYEDLLAAITRPIRFYDFNGDGLSAEEVQAVTAAQTQQARTQTVARLLRYDLNDDRVVTLDEVETGERIALAEGNSGNSDDDLAQRHDVNGDGQITFEEMFVIRPDEKRMLNANNDRLVAATATIDPTPDTNFTLADARAIIDAVFATYDKDRNGFLDPNELQKARGGN